MKLLIIDDEVSLRPTRRLTLESMGRIGTEAPNSARALELLGHRQFDVAFHDLRLACKRGLELWPELLRLAPGLHTVMVTLAPRSRPP